MATTMDKKLIAKFDEKRDELKARFKSTHPAGYDAIFTALCEVLTSDGWDGDYPDPARITVIDHGEYQGTRVFVVGATGYQPSVYWMSMVSYGSCSGCDTFESTREYGDDPPTDEQADAYFTMALHMLQGMRQIPESR